MEKTPRFREVEVEFLGKSIKAPDSASLLFLNRELFGNEIYKFKTDSDKPFIIDGGANIGLSIIYFKMLYPKAKIIAFEADPKIFEYLKYNIDSFGFDDVMLINKALWDEEITLEFFSEGSDGGRIATKEDKEKITKVETTKLSNYLQNRKVDFLKLDIEGAEYRVLNEAKKYIRNIPNIYIEYHSFKHQKQNLAKILDILQTNDMRYYIEHIGVKSPHPFIKINESLGFDNQLHIFGYKK